MCGGVCGPSNVRNIESAHQSIPDRSAPHACEHVLVFRGFLVDVGTLAQKGRKHFRAFDEPQVEQPHIANSADGFGAERNIAL
jgi:hypothetical protein